MNARGRRLGLLLLIFCVLAISAVVVVKNSQVQAPTGRLEIFETPYWIKEGQVFLRAEAARSPVLLLAQLSTLEQIEAPEQTAATTKPAQGVFYRYDPILEHLTQTSPRLWDSAEGPIGACSGGTQGDAHPIDTDPFTDALRFHGRPIETAGTSVVNYAKAPFTDWVAVVSAAGPRVAGGLIFNWRPRRWTGTHYHEVFSRADGRRRGKHVELPFTSEQREMLCCWSPDLTYVVYTDADYTKLCIVRVDLSEADVP